MKERKGWEVLMVPAARRQFAKLPRHVQKDIDAKILWLAEHAEEIRHERLKGRTEFSLHIGQYRILYELDRKQRRIIITRIAPHNAAYRQ